MLTASKVRTFLRIEDDEFSDEDINNYIDHYSARILAEIGSAAQQDPNIQNNALFQNNTSFIVLFHSLNGPDAKGIRATNLPTRTISVWYNGSSRFLFLSIQESFSL